MGGCVPGKQSERQYKDITIKADPFLDINLRKSLLSGSIFRDEGNAGEIVNQLLGHIKERFPDKSRISIERIFRASEFKFKASEFHKKCENKSNTVVIALTSQNKIFGGFTPCTWIKSQIFNYEQDTASISFLFAVKDSVLSIFKIKSKESSKAICNHEQSGPIFGEGHDLYINDQCDKRESWNNLGKTYQSKYTYGTQKANKELGGQLMHKIKEYEVWEITT